MTRRVEKDLHGIPRLMLGEARARLHRLAHSRVEVVDLDVEVEHLVLAVRSLGPHRRPVGRLALEGETRASVGVRINTQSGSRAVTSHSGRRP